MAAEEDSEECTSKLLSTITQTTSSGGAKVPDAETAYHVMIDCEQLQTPLLVSPVALIKLHRRARSWVAWTEFGSVGLGRRAVLGKSDKSSQGSGHPGLDPALNTANSTIYSVRLASC